jgi:hypothetical protein
MSGTKKAATAARPPVNGRQEAVVLSNGSEGRDAIFSIELR